MINIRIEKINDINKDVKKITDNIGLKEPITTDLNLDEVKNRIKFNNKDEIYDFIENANDFVEKNQILIYPIKFISNDNKEFYIYPKIEKKEVECEVRYFRFDDINKNNICCLTVDKILEYFSNVDLFALAEHIIILFGIGTLDNKNAIAATLFGIFGILMNGYKKYKEQNIQVKKNELIINVYTKYYRLLITCKNIDNEDIEYMLADLERFLGGRI